MGASEDVLDFLGAVGGEISDQLGRVTPIIAQAMPYPGSQASLSTLLHNLEKRGFIVRDIRHRRTYAVKLTAPRPSVVAAGSGGPSDNGSTAASLPSTPRSAESPAGKRQGPTDAWAAERAIYSAAIGRARQRINEFEVQLSQAMMATEEAVGRADDLQEKMAMAERTIGSMRTQLLDARKQIDLLRRKGSERRPASPKIAGNHAAAGAEWDRLMREGPDR